jgi:hypothetical protein
MRYRCGKNLPAIQMPEGCRPKIAIHKAARAGRQGRHILLIAGCPHVATACFGASCLYNSRFDGYDKAEKKQDK